MHGSNGIGVGGKGYYGVQGLSGSAGGAGVVGTATGTANSAVFSGGSGVVINGNFTVTNGTKAATVSTHDGYRQLYSEEATELWFSDYGSGQLHNGKCTIKLDPLFMETVTITDECLFLVFTQLQDESKGVYIKKYLDRFEVIENQNGASNAHFDFRIVAKRKDFEDKRLEKVILPSLVN